MAGRRIFLQGLAAATIVPVRGWAAAGRPSWVTAGQQHDGTYTLCGIEDSGQIVFAIPLPGRGHAAAAHPYRAEAVAFARRPGIFGLVIDCQTGAVTRRLSPPAGRQFNGHGTFSADGQWLYTSEVVAQGSAGRIGVWDVRDDYKRIGEWTSHGIGPHEIRLLPGGDIVVANGGIETDPDDRTPLNLNKMRPNLTVIDAEGKLVSKREYPQLSRNSIRHLTLIAGGVAFATQWNGDLAQVVPLLGMAIGAQPICMYNAPATDEFAMRGYAGSIAAKDDLIAITSPRGGVAMMHDISGNHLATLRRADICGVAGSGGGGFVMTDGSGAIWHADPEGLHLLARHQLSWDNHLVAINT